MLSQHLNSHPLFHYVSRPLNVGHPLTDFHYERRVISEKKELKKQSQVGQHVWIVKQMTDKGQTQPLVLVNVLLA